MLCSAAPRKDSRCAPARKKILSPGERSARLAGMLGAGLRALATARLRWSLSPPLHDTVAQRASKNPIESKDAHAVPCTAGPRTLLCWIPRRRSPDPS
ncbi:hypothetical protein PR002_g30791 [Phytophthora rubi]|uniref:Uncharacterized protein n=1 Tax=Phytophthora rubi TaxID=129364 RepID=A0A6A3GNL9_9STRA|nr:hypothetical protein PR002_g30791 [Phytophthora rubi]